MALDNNTADRLLHAARHEFAAVGYERGSVRRICEAADANVSAVKYHFGSKGSLYRAVWRHTAQQMFASHPMPRLKPGDDPRAVLRELVVWFLHLVIDPTRVDPLSGPMLAHEAAGPTEDALDIFAELCAKPICHEIRGIVCATTGLGRDTRAAETLTAAVVALCVTPQNARELLTRVGAPPPTDPRAIRRMAHTLADFALAGLDGFKEAR